jgi:predicted DNA-binding ribbon-helix-helix protein
MSLPVVESAYEKQKAAGVAKRSVVIDSHKTSISLEDAFWKALHDIAQVQSITLSCLISSINTERQHPNLSSALRLFILNYYLSRCEGHEKPK